MPVTRREFLKRVGIAVGGFGLAATGYERLVPYVRQPDDIVPGESTWFATACRECPAGCGMVVRNRESRVVKCEGNPAHPINSGALCARGQAALQGLYDPDRIKTPLKKTPAGKLEPTDWTVALDAAARAVSGSKTAVMTDLETGSMAALINSWLAALGSDLLVMYEPVDYEPVRRVYGGAVPSFDIAGSDFLISFGADFLETWLSPVEYARQFAMMREVKNDTRGYFVYAGPRVSATAAAADVRVLIPPGAERAVAAALAGDDLRIPGADDRLLSVIAEKARRAKRPLALPGLTEVAAAAAEYLNRLWNTGLVRTGRPHAVSRLTTRSGIRGLLSEMHAGNIDTLVVINSNPAYSLPVSEGFADALKRVKNVICLSPFRDETAELADWVLPVNHPLESWGDYEPYPDVRNLMQPVMGNLFGTRHAGDVLIEISRRAGINPSRVFGAESFYAFVRKRWGCPVPEDGSPDTAAREWEAMVRVGGVWPGPVPKNVTPPTGYSSVPARASAAAPAIRTAVSAGSAADAPADAGSVAAAGAEPAAKSLTAQSELQLYVYPHPFLYDGRGANKGWLQELPEPVIKTVWGSCAELNPETAKQLGVKDGDAVRVAVGGAYIDVPAVVWEGVAPGTVAVAAGQGHSSYGRSARNRGANPLRLIGPGAANADARPAGKTARVVRTGGNPGQHGRAIVQFVSIHHLHDHGSHNAHHELTLPLPEGYGPKDFYPGHDHKDYRWAMVVDLSRCVGCGACVAACYAENNVGVVGPESVARGREMSWIRIDRYIDWGKPEAPVVFQPMMCQQCDSAPCETVCPVYAAVHSEDGINEQVYNRCVGTRYCANNCPYKVRRFNWFDYKWPEPLNYQLNPDVTVRCRGVMEKCTFCVQRIRQARKTARREGRKIRDGEVTPACVGTCPTGALVFGDLMDPKSRVSKTVRNDPRAYQALHELNTKPGVIYLRRVVEELEVGKTPHGPGKEHG